MVKRLALQRRVLAPASAPNFAPNATHRIKDARAQARPTSGSQTETQSPLIVQLYAAKFEKARHNYSIRISSFRYYAIDCSLMTLYGCFGAPRRRSDRNLSAARAARVSAEVS